jgi:GMP synthase-like glutamine amidotransferase
MRLAVIDNALDHEIYRPVEHWASFLGKTRFQGFEAPKNEFPDPTDFTHIILTGSEASIVERAGWAEEEARLVRAAAVPGGPAILGSCWGHQLLAYALAGPGHIRRRPGPEIGWVPIRVRTEDVLLGEPGVFYAFSIHFDEVFDPPEGLFDVLADSDDCAVQAVRVRGGNIWGIQFHPEIDPETAVRFLRDLVQAGFRGREEMLRALACPTRDDGTIRRIVDRFLSAA